jgi:LysR family glycine cleavage system transcriptional activator
MYRRELTQAFSRIELATRRISNSRRSETLNVVAYTTFATNWLIPRLTEFHDQHPEIDVRLTASLQPVDFQRDETHCAVRTGPPGWDPGVRIDKLYESWLFPVAAPDLAPTEWPVERLEDIARRKLLHSIARPDDWRIWLEAAGLPNVDPDTGMKFESSTMAYLAAQQGLGVAIAQDFLVRDQLKAGSLVRLFDIEAKSDRVYYLLSSPNFEGTPSLEIFRSWLLDQSSPGGG